MRSHRQSSLGGCDSHRPRKVGMESQQTVGERPPGQVYIYQIMGSDCNGHGLPRLRTSALLECGRQKCIGIAGIDWRRKIAYVFEESQHFIVGSVVRDEKPCMGC